MYDSTRKRWFDRNDDTQTQRRKKQRFIRNSNSGIEFSDEMFDKRSSYQILFPTLNIADEFREDVSFWTMRGFRERLFRHIKDARAYERYRRRIGKPLKEHERSILHDIQSLIWTQERGNDGGDHHLHLVVFLSVSRRDHARACDELGLYWIHDVTHGWGDFDNPARYRRDYKNRFGVAIGYLHRNDDDKREALRKLIGLYMSKTTTLASGYEDQDHFGKRDFDVD